MTNHVSNCQKAEDQCLKLVVEETFEMLETVEEVSDHVLGGSSSVHCYRCCPVLSIDRSKVLESQSWRWSFVVFRNLVQDLDCLGFSASRKKELGRFIESEDEEPKEEDSESHAAEYDALVSPTHVA